MSRAGEGGGGGGEGRIEEGWSSEHDGRHKGLGSEGCVTKSRDAKDKG